jgi:hypothetical protein
MKTKVIIWILASGLLILQPGCVMLGLAAAGAAGGGYVAYDRGDLEVLEPIAYDDAFNAVDITVEELGMALQLREKKPLTGVVKAKSHYGKITYSLENAGEKLTQIKIRVGTFGDQAAQRRIYAELKTNYGAGPRVDPETGLPK